MKPIRKAFNSVVKDIDVAKRTLTAVISTNAVDRMGDIVDPKGVSFKNFNKNPVVAWAHNYEAPPIGRSLWIKRSGDAILSKMEFATTEFANEIFELYKGGFLNAFSIGFIPTEKAPIDEERPYGAQRYIKSELLEYSAVPVPANPEALAMAMRKGILKSETLIDDIQHEMDEPKEEPEEDEPSEEEKEPKGEQTPLEEVQEENKTLVQEKEGLKEQIKILSDENTSLRYQLYLLNKRFEESNSKITVSNFKEKAFEIANGVIRKHQGRV